MSDVSGFTIRDLTDYEDLERCVAFQKLIWGTDFLEVVPPAILMVANRTGGIVAAAFDDDDDIAGFIFGITGFHAGAPLHWSDMLGVRPDLRGRGIGQALKRHQRNSLLGRGINLVRWTFDPLEARNAFINFHRLGCTAREYVRDCYGTSNSPLHAGIGTDRLIVDWQLDSPAVRHRMDTPAARTGERTPADAPFANPPGAGPVLDLPAPTIRVRIPRDIQTVRDVDISAAINWRRETRAVFEAYLGRGYTVTDVQIDTDGNASYVLRNAAVPVISS